MQQVIGINAGHLCPGCSTPVDAHNKVCDRCTAIDENRINSSATVGKATAITILLGGMGVMWLVHLLLKNIARG